MTWWTAVVRDADGNIDENASTAKDLTGYTARMHVRRRHSDDDALIELTTANGRISLGGTAGTIILTLTPTDLDGVPSVVGVHDLELVDGAGAVTRLVEGEIEFTPEATR